MAAHPTRRLARWLAITEIVLFATAAIALGWYAVVRVSAARDQATWTRELEQHAETISERSLPATAQRRRLEKGALIGRIELPRLGVSAIAREGADAVTLRRSVGHVPETALPGEPGNAALAGHRDTFFRGLKDVREGDHVVVTTLAGRHQYIVREMRVVEPSDVSVLDPTDEAMLTLVTCYPFNYVGAAPQRFVVRAALVGSPVPAVATAMSTRR